MVFESVVADFLNFYLGKYIENLDSSQLNVSVWNGDVVLRDLKIKESALDDINFGFPIKVKVGRIGKLEVSIPWTNLYKEAVVIQVEDVFVLAVPDFVSGYNAQRYSKVLQDAKQLKLERIEEVRKLKATPSVPKVEKSKGFAETLGFEVIKNLQLNVINIHIRYEDSITNLQRPFSVGLCLKELLFQTADQNWVSGDVDETADVIYKVVRLDNLFLYWNSMSVLFGGMAEQDVLRVLRETLISNEQSGFDYIVQPVFLAAHLNINTSPEKSNFSIPKIMLVIVFEEIAMCVSKDQYDDIQMLNMSIEKRNILSLYERHRPAFPLLGYARLWWRYAYRCVYEAISSRHTAVWSWSHIKDYRIIMKNYREAYIHKLTDRKLSEEMESALKKGEQILDAESISFMRQEAEVSAAKHPKPSFSLSYYSLFGSTTNPSNRTKRLDTNSTHGKSHQPSVYDLQDIEVDHSLPIDFVALKVLMKLTKATLCLKVARQECETNNERNCQDTDAQIIEIQLEDVYASFKQRPAANAFLLEAKLDTMVINGKPQGGMMPKLIITQPSEKEHEYAVLTMALETNPIDDNCDTSIKFRSRPLQITYDSETASELLKFFKQPGAVRQLRASQSARSQSFTPSRMTRSGISHLLDQHKHTDIYLDIMSLHLVLPEKGFMAKTCTLMVLDVGQLKLTSKKQFETTKRADTSTRRRKDRPSTSSLQNELLEKMSEAYEEFQISLCTQLLLARSEENWRQVLEAGESDCHIIFPFTVHLNLKVCMVQNDPRMARMKGSGVLPNLLIRVSNISIQKILCLLYSIPSPEVLSATEEGVDINVAWSHHPSTGLGMQSLSTHNAALLESTNFTDMEMAFEIREFVLSLVKIHDKETTLCLKLTTKSAASFINMRTYDMEVEARIHSFTVQYSDHSLFSELYKQPNTSEAKGGSPIYLVKISNSNKCLTINFRRFYKESLIPSTDPNRAKFALCIDLSSPELLLHNEAFVLLKEFVQLLTSPTEQATTQELGKTLSSAGLSREEDRCQPLTTQNLNITILNINVLLEQLSFSIPNNNDPTDFARVKDIRLNIKMQEQQMIIDATVQKLKLFDPDPTLTVRTIIDSKGLIKVLVVIYSNGSFGEKYDDMSCVDTQVDLEISGVHITFRQKYLDTLWKCLDKFETAWNEIQGQEPVIQVEEKVSRMALNIRISSLAIVLPTNQMSSKCLVLKIECLKVHNLFKKVSYISPCGVPAVLEDITLAFVSSDVFTALVGKDGKIHIERLLTDPKTFSITVQRNVSREWYHGEAYLKVNSSVDQLNFRMLPGDHDTIWQVLCEILYEESEMTAATENKSNEESRENLPDHLIAEATPQTSIMWLVANIEFSRPKVHLYRASRRLDSGIRVHNKDLILAVINFETISVNSSMSVDGQTDCELSVTGFAIDDFKAAKKSQATRMAECSKPNDKQSDSGFVSVEYMQDSDSDTRIKVSVTSCYVYFLFQFWKGLSDFFDKYPERKGSDSSQTTTISCASTAATSEAQCGSTEIVLCMEELEVVFPENSTKLNANIFIVDTKLSFHMLLSSHETVMNSTLSGLQAFMSTLQQRHNQSNILRPCNVTFYGISKHNESNCMFITIDRIILHASPVTIYTMATTFSSLVFLSDPSQSELQDADTRQKLPNASFGNLWAVKKVKDEQFWFLEHFGSSSLAYEADRISINEVPTLNVDEELLLSIPSIVVILEGETSYGIIPLIMAESSSEIQVNNWSSAMSVEGTVDLEAHYYNEKLAAWEPLIETIKYEYEKDRRWNLNLTIQMHVDSATAFDEEQKDHDEPVVMLPSKMHISITSSDALQVCVTGTCLEVLTHLSKAFGEASGLTSGVCVQEMMTFPYVFQNETGCEMILRLDSTFNQSTTADSQDITLGVGASLNAYNKSDGKSRGKRSYIKVMQEGERHKIMFSLKNFPDKQVLAVKRAEKRLFNIGQESIERQAWGIVCNTECTLGQKVVTFQSILRIKSGLPISAQVLAKDSRQFYECGTVEPGGYLNVPVEAVYSASDLFFRPVGDTYGASDTPYNWWNAIDGEVSEISCSSLQPDRPAYLFSIYRETEMIYCMSVDEKKEKAYVISLQTSIAFRNLLTHPVNFTLKNVCLDEQAAVNTQLSKGICKRLMGIFRMHQQSSTTTPGKCPKQPERAAGQSLCGGSTQATEQVSHQASKNTERPQTNRFLRTQSSVLEQAIIQQGSSHPTEHASFYNAKIVLQIVSYLEQTWVGQLTVERDMPELTVLEFIADGHSDGRSLELGVHCKLQNGTLKMSLYSPYWLLNKTGRKLLYIGPGHLTPVAHEADRCEPILFFFPGMWMLKEKHKVSKTERDKKIQLQIGNSKWSDKFSLNTVGSSGTVYCNSNEKNTSRAEVGVSVQLSESGLTKIVTFTPYYMILNNSAVTILVTEKGEDIWQSMSPRQCLPFWPRAASKSVRIQARVKDTTEVTGPFPISKAHTTLLKLSNQYGGIHADCQESEAFIITMLQTYSPGLATVCVINHTDHFTVSFRQCNENSKMIVQEKHYVLYTWENALGKRELEWNCGKKRCVKTDLSDGMDEFYADGNSKMYWVSFLDGIQRILLFTGDISIVAASQEAKSLSMSGELERMEQEIIVQLQAFGISLVNDHRQTEVALLGITSSGILWEERRKRFFKPMDPTNNKLVEDAWQHYHSQLALGKAPRPRVALGNSMEFDITNKTITMAMVHDFCPGSAVTFAKPKMHGQSDTMLVKQKTIPVRRTFRNGIWLQYKASTHCVQFHAKVNRLQLDNQLTHAVFPVVLCPVPPPKSIAVGSVPKTFVELSLRMKMHEHSKITQIQYFKVLIQEMSMKVDQGFLLAMVEMFSMYEPISREDEAIQFKNDIEKTERTLVDITGLSLGEVHRNVYDYVHFSPIKIHYSFSLQKGTGSSDDYSSQQTTSRTSVFLQSVGVVLTDVQDVVLKLSYFQRSNTFCDQSQVTRQMIRHYAGQAIKQIYLLVFGLDVLGNPFGLLRGFSEGIEDLFYEPYKGAIQGPDEFAEGVALGVRSLFGHTVGGAAGAVSRITGTLGKGLATLTLDESYQKKRREQINNPSTSVRENVAQSSKGLVMSVIQGVTGVVRKPMEGAKKEGMKGFAKGVGKGLVGVVTHPTSGIVDFASSSFQEIQRIVETGVEIKRLRPPRRFFKDRVIRPYDRQESEGDFILKQISKGEYAQTDEYQAHSLVDEEGKSVLLVTDKRILFAKRGQIFGTWDCDWSFVWIDLKHCPTKTDKGILIVLNKAYQLHTFSSRVTEIEVAVPGSEAVNVILATIHNLMS